MQPTPQPQNHPPAHSTAQPWGMYGVVALGLLVFVLLLLADRTALQPSRNGDAATATPTQAPAAPAAGTNDLPAGPDGQVIAGLRKELAAATTDAARLRALDRLVAASVNADRPDLAAAYQAQAARLAPDAEQLRKSARLHLSALNQAVAQGDSAAVRRWDLQTAAAYDAYLANSPDDLDAAIDRALLHVRSGDPARMMPKGILALRSLAEQHPENLRAGIELGRFSLQTQQFDKAEDRFRAAAQAHPDRPEPHYWLGMTYAQQGRARDARAAFTAAQQRKPDAALARAIQEALQSLQ